MHLGQRPAPRRPPPPRRRTGSCRRRPRGPAARRARPPRTRRRRRRRRATARTRPTRARADRAPRPASAPTARSPGTRTPPSAAARSCSAGLLATYRPLARIAERRCSGGTVDAAPRSDRQRATAAITTRNVAALTKNVVLGPVAATSAPPSAGPTARARFMFDRAERDRLRPLVGRHQLGLQCLPRRRRPRLARTDGEQQREQCPRRHHPRLRQHRQQQRGGEHPRLRDQQQPPPVDEIADRTRRDREQQHRQRRRRLDQREQRGRARHRQHQPLRADGLHPRADVAGQLRRPQRPERSVTERLPRAVHPMESRHRMRGGGRYLAASSTDAGRHPL